MQLKSINKLEKFPPFNIKPDSSEKCENFGHFNLIYAQNGTGKTTVTRFMNLLSCGKIPVKNEKRYESYKDFNSSIMFGVCMYPWSLHEMKPHNAVRLPLQ